MSDLEKKRKKPRIKERVVYHVNAGNIQDYGDDGYSTPQHAQAEGFQAEMAKPDTDKTIAPVHSTFAVMRRGLPRPGG
jgi:hypothetical protein